ncbi:MAG: phosphoglycolate phosphatase [Paracoccaceae bacterium]|nr:phosphoglycolate phosphatase [Paracoccaceae bacterium]
MSRIVFDLDGTLIDSAPDIHLGVNMMLEEQGEAALDLATVTSFIGNGLPHLVKLVMMARDINPDHHTNWVAAMDQHYERANGQLTRLYPGVRQCLDQLHSDGHSLAICTNKPLRPAKEILAKFGLEALFDQIVGGDSLPSRKPDPEMLLACFAANRGLYVGDSEVDAETADRATIPFALFRHGYRKKPVEQLVHTYGFDDFSELQAIVTDFQA